GPGSGGVTMVLGVPLRAEGRRGSQRRLGKGGRYLGTPRNGGSAAPTINSENAEAHDRSLLSVHETGCGTAPWRDDGLEQGLHRPYRHGPRRVEDRADDEAICGRNGSDAPGGRGGRQRRGINRGQTQGKGSAKWPSSSPVTWCSSSQAVRK